MVDELQGSNIKKYWKYFSSLESLLGTLAAVSIGLCLIGVAWWSAADSSDEGNTADCVANILPALATDQLAVVGIWPQQTVIGGRICVGVTGVISSEAETNNSKKVEEAKSRIARLEGDLSNLNKAAPPDKQAISKVEADLVVTRKLLDDALSLQGQERTEPLTLFLNDIPAKGINAGAKSGTDDDTATVIARRTSQFQIVVVELKTSSEAGADLWGKVLRGTRVIAEKPPKNESSFAKLQRNFTAWGSKTVYVGLAHGNASSPEIVGKDSVKIRVYYVPVLMAGVLSLLLFGACLVLVANKTSLLRDSSLMEVPRDPGLDGKIQKAAIAIALRDEAQRVADEAADQANNLAGELPARVKALADATTALNSVVVGDAMAEANAKDKVAAAEKSVTDLSTEIATAQQKVTALQLIADDERQAYVEISQAVRDAGQPASIGRPVGTFSLARTQIAMWIVLTLAGFLFIWLTTGQYNNLLTPEILVLLGITAASTFTSIQLTKAISAKDARRTEGFFKDLVYDKDGPSLYRLQALAWTLVLAVIFTWGVFWDFSFAKFDNNLLLFTGIFQSMYLGFKYQTQQPSN